MKRIEFRAAHFVGLLAVFCLLLGSTIVAQTTVTIDAGDQYGTAGAGNRHVVKSSAGNLYMIRMDSNVAGTRTLVLGVSFNGGSTWQDIVTSGINDASTGESGTNLVNAVSMAIDDLDVLHIIWKVSATGYYNQFYRTVDANSFALGTVYDFNVIHGLSASTKSSSCAVEVDANNTVWFIVKGAASWRGQLIHSDAPYATTGTFTSVGYASASASAQFTRMAIDVNGVIHTTYYENTGSGDHRHRAYDPVAGTWGVATDLGDLAPVNDYISAVACDYLGNTHMICNRNTHSSGNPSVEYYKRDAAGTFTGPITVTSATNAQFNGIGNQHTIDLVCNETTGDVYVVYRDFANGGGLQVDALITGVGAFVPFTTLGTANTAQHHYYIPRMRGTMYPATNNTGTDIHVTWREMWPAPYDLKFFAISPGPPVLPTYMGNGTDADMKIFIDGSPDVQPTKVHNINAGQLLGISYESPLGTLDGTPFLSLIQLFNTGAPPTPTTLAGDPAPSVYYSALLPSAVLADGLSNPGALFLPRMSMYSLTGGIPLFLSGSGKSLMLSTFTIDSILPSGFGSTDAHEFIVQ